MSLRRSVQHAGRCHPIRPRYYSEEAKTNAAGSAPSPSEPLTGSAKLFSDAKQEDLRPKSAHLQTLESQAQHANWDGDERIEDTVLRMLVDKYKPLRSRSTGSDNGIESADEKLKRSVPRVTISTREEAEGSKEDHKPWHTTFKIPSHAEASIKFANIPIATATTSSTQLPFSSSSSTNPNAIKDDRTKRLERETKKRTEQVGRLTRARESTLDYKMGITPMMKNSDLVASQGGRVNPVTMKGWASLVEDQIERARSRGVFNVVKGRGKPLARMQEESNPFIAREEFLMNRIVQRNGAAPPWVEVQVELESSIRTFRQILRQSWIRRAVRLLRSSTPAELRDTITLSQVEGLRDEEWFCRERSYHQAALEEVNSLVRKYNALAPYAVRRPYYMLEVEVGRLFEECADEIFSEVKKTEDVGGDGAQAEVGARGSGEDSANFYGFAEFVKEMLTKFGWTKR
ncbi:hypothetical protein F5887DRAFT_1282543 [Amanita rubescens]|nr:hypothetical protein F5887DRAFT_1282543 [Amanita rubescens]